MAHTKFNHVSAIFHEVSKRYLNSEYQLQNYNQLAHVLKNSSFNPFRDMALTKFHPNVLQ